MRRKEDQQKDSAEKAVREIRRATRRRVLGLLTRFVNDHFYAVLGGKGFEATMGSPKADRLQRTSAKKKASIPQKLYTGLS